MRFPRLVLGVCCLSLSMSAAVWEPKPAPGGAPIESNNVRIVKLGTEYTRGDDGGMFTISQLHRYRIVTNDTTKLLTRSTAGDDRQVFNDYDVDGDGVVTNDAVAAHVFSMTRTMSPDLPFYDTSVGTHRMYGGTAIYTADADDPSNPVGYSEDGINDYEEGPAYQPRRNWTLFNETYAIYSPYRMYGLFLWKKDDFLNGGAQWPVTFDGNSVLAHLVMRYYMGIEGFRWVVRNNNQFYISQTVYQYADSVPGGVGGKVHQLVPSATQWAEYNPGVAKSYDIAFDAATASFAARVFTNVTAVGYLMCKNSLINGYVGYKWYTFEARAVVQRPQRPSESIDMLAVPGAGAVQNFYLSTCEVPYFLWNKVYRFANNNEFCLEPRGAAFDNDGDMGSMDLPVSNGVYGTHTTGEPVTDVTLHDVLIWCNALSIQESREPVYYTDAVMTSVYLEALYCPFYNSAPPIASNIYVKWNADGYRLPTPKEWERAATLGNQQYTAAYGWLGANASNTTHVVGGLLTNALGCYDMAGNVWELTWPFGDTLALATAPPLLALGGDLHYPTHPTNVSASAYGDRPYDGNYNVGFRLVRRDKGLAAPDGSTNISATIPAWRIASNDRNMPVPARQLVAPLASNWLALLSVPGAAFGQHEVTFAEWQPVYDWAVARGYQFDYDAAMGSMAYWGWGAGWQPGAHGPKEPATGMSRFDAVTWLNALSALEGRTPYYYTSSGLTAPVTNSYLYRPLMKTLGEGSGQVWAHSAMIAWPTYGTNNAANGYRLPYYDEFLYVAKAGNTGRTYPWGNDITQVTKYAWVIDNSSLRTQPVGLLRTNEWGFADMMGNVSEMSETADSNFANLSKERLGLSFLDISSGYPKTADRGTLSSRGYPDVGLRVVRHGAGATLLAPAAAVPLYKRGWRRSPAPGDFSAAVSPITDDAAKVGAASTLRSAGSSKIPQPPLGKGDGQIATPRSAAAIPLTKGGQRGLLPPAAASLREKLDDAAAPAALAYDPATFNPLEGLVHRGNLGRSGVFKTSGVPSLKGLKWKFQTGGPVKSSPVVVNGVCYVGSYDGGIYALDADTGALKWSNKTTKAVSGSAAVVNNRVYIAGEDGYLYALDAGTGTQQWRVLVAGQARPIAGSPAVAYGTVFIGGGGAGGSRVLNMTSRNIYGYDVNTGTQTWQSTSTGPQGYAALCLDTNRMYAGIGGSNYAAYDLANGATLWNRAAGQQNRQFMSMSYVDGYVYFPGTMRGSVTKLTTGNTRLWQVATQVTNMLFEMNAGGIFGNEILTDVAVAHSRVYTGCNDGKLYAFWQSNGSNSWSYPTGGKVQSSPAVASNMVYFGSNDGWFYALDALSGSLVWKYNAGAPIVSAPWPANGVVYFGCDDGAVYALQSGGPTARILSAAPASGNAPLIVTFAARATAGDAAVSNCTWQFGDDTTATNGPALTNVVHTYFSTGSHTAVFTVADYAGTLATDSAVISVVPEVMAGAVVCVLLALAMGRYRARA